MSKQCSIPDVKCLLCPNKGNILVKFAVDCKNCGSFYHRSCSKRARFDSKGVAGFCCADISEYKVKEKEEESGDKINRKEDQLFPNNFQFVVEESGDHKMNEEFKKMWSDMEGLVSRLAKDIKEIKDLNANLSENVKIIKKDVGNLAEGLADIKKRVAENEIRIGDLEEKINTLEGSQSNIIQSGGEAVEEVIKEMNMRRLKETSLIIFNLDDGPDSIIDDLSTIKKWFVGAPFDLDRIKVYRIGKYKQELKRPVKVGFSAVEDVHWVLSNQRSSLQQGVTIRKDLTRRQQMVYKETFREFYNRKKMEKMIS